MHSPADDPGLARERTVLAWERTALLFVALGGLVLLAVAHRGELAAGGPIALILTGLGLAVRRVGRRRLLPHDGRATRLADPLGPLTATAATVSGAVLIALLVLVGGDAPSVSDD